MPLLENNWYNQRTSRTSLQAFLPNMSSVVARNWNVILRHTENKYPILLFTGGLFVSLTAAVSTSSSSSTWFHWASPSIHTKQWNCSFHRGDGFEKVCTVYNHVPTSNNNIHYLAFWNFPLFSEGSWIIFFNEQNILSFNRVI